MAGDALGMRRARSGHWTDGVTFGNEGGKRLEAEAGTRSSPVAVARRLPNARRIFYSWEKMHSVLAPYMLS